MHLNNEEMKFNVANVMKFSVDVEYYSVIEDLGWDYCKEEIYRELFSTKKFFKDELKWLEEVNFVIGEKECEHLDLENKGDKGTKPSIEEPPELELKLLPPHPKYVFLVENDTLPIITSASFNGIGERALLNMQKRQKKAIRWNLADIQGISPSRSG